MVATRENDETLIRYIPTASYKKNDVTNRFRFVETRTLEPAQLELQIATAAPGFFESGWRKAVAALAA